MRTNIVLDDKLIKEAFKYADVSTKRELVDLALREFIDNHRRKDLRELKNKKLISSEYDYKSLRNNNKE